LYIEETIVATVGKIHGLRRSLLNKKEETPRSFKMPHTYVILFVFIIAAAVLSWIIPAGQFETVMLNGREAIDPNAFHYIENNG